MKAFIAAVSAMVLITAFVFFNSFFSARLIDEITDFAEQVNEGTTPDEMQSLSEAYMNRRAYLALTVSHKDLSDIEDLIAELIGSATVGDEDGIEVTKSRLISALAHLRRLCAITFDSIL